MECPDDAAVAAMLVTNAPPMAGGLFEDHIDDCDSCRQLLAGLIRRAELDEARAWRPGDRAGRYIIRERIGRGGMGAVYRADDVELGRAIALKRLHADDAERLVREARSAAQLQHPNVVTVYEVVDNGGAPFLAMELVEGQTLTAWLRETKRTWREVVAVVAQAGRGLAAAHARGLVHRDFKPDNILVDREGRARVADFGLASVDTRVDASDIGCRLARATAAGGTPAYMAPELLDGEPPDARSDQFAFAVTLYEALHGKHPFAGTSPDAMWAEMAVGRVRDGGGRVPARIERFVRRGLAVDPAERWPDVASFVAAIEHRPRRLAFAGAAFAGFAVGAIAFVASPGRAVDDDCNDDLVSAAWDSPARAAVAAQFTKIAPNRAAPVLAATEQIVERWADSWRLARKASCNAAPERRNPQIACLDRQLGELRGQLADWERGDAESVDRAIRAASTLPMPTECATAQDTPLYVQSVATRVSEVRVLWRAGRAKEAMPKLPAIVRDAEALGHHHTLADALLTASILEEETGEDAAAAEHATRAGTEASKAGDDALLYSVLIQQAYVRLDGGRPLDALGLCDAAEALAARGLPNAEKVYVARGGAYMRIGRTADAVAQFERAAVALEKASARDPVAKVQLAIPLASIGQAYLMSQQPDRALPYQMRALALQQAEFGTNHPEVARTEYEIALTYASMRKFAESEKHQRRSREILVAAYGTKHHEVGQADVALGNLAARQHHNDEARRLFEQAKGELTSLPPTHQIFEVIEGTLGSLAQNDNKCGEAIPHYQRVIEISLANHVGGNELGRGYGSLAVCQLDVGKTDEAKVNAERALEQLATADVPSREKAIPWMVLALAADKRGDRAHAIDYARKVMAGTTDADRGEAAEARQAMRDKLRSWSR
jgi:tRNA A-37 threonylcarbamoyl transferase component Bud32/tetratricopeptide (TPR) repeat protein